MTKVADLREALLVDDEQYVSAELGDVEYDPIEGLKLPDMDPVNVDDKALGELAAFLGLSGKAYFRECPPDLRATNINFWMNYHPTVVGMFRMQAGELISVHSPQRKVIRTKQLVSVVEQNFDEECEVRSIINDPTKFQIDITDPDVSIEVPGTGTEERPSVGDITESGVRITMTQTASGDSLPLVQSYFHRLVCSNGMTQFVPNTTIKVRGKTVDDVLADLEEVFEKINGAAPEQLDAYKDSANIHIPGNVTQFVWQMGNERQLSSRVLNRVIGRVPELPQNPTAYDVLQLFTTTANEEVTQASRELLQSIGGDLGFNTEHALHRCSNCNHLLD